MVRISMGGLFFFAEKYINRSSFYRAFIGLVISRFLIHIFFLDIGLMKVFYTLDYN